jgi:hypothetical protein
MTLGFHFVFGRGVMANKYCSPDHDGEVVWKFIYGGRLED